MPINPDAAIEVTAFRWVPDLARGLVRDPFPEVDDLPVRDR